MDKLKHGHEQREMSLQQQQQQMVKKYDTHIITEPNERAKKKTTKDLIHQHQEQQYQ